MTVRHIFLTTSLLLQSLLPALAAGWITLSPEQARPHRRTIAIVSLVLVSLLATTLFITVSPAMTAGPDETRLSATGVRPAITILQGTLVELSVDQNRAGLLALAAWISLTALLQSPGEENDPGEDPSRAMLWIHTGTALLISAEHFLLSFTGWSLTALVVAMLLQQAPRQKKQHPVTGLFLVIQLAGLMSLVSALALASGTAALMQSAPYGPPKTVSFSLQGLANLLSQSALKHPAAAEIHSQVSDGLFLALAVSIWLSTAQFPFHRWFIRIWETSPFLVRLWLGTIGLKLPLLRLQPVLNSYLGASAWKFLLALTIAGLAGAFVTSCVAASEKRRDIVLANLVLVANMLATLLVAFHRDISFLSIAGLSAGVVLLLSSTQGAIKESGWTRFGLILATLAIGFVPGGSGFALWRELTTLIWQGLTPVSGSLFLILLLSAVITTVALTQLLIRHEAPLTQHLVQGSPVTSPLSAEVRMMNLKALLLAWGGVVVLLSAMSFVTDAGSATDSSQPENQEVELNRGLP